MAINWGLAQTPDFASAALGGYQAGQALQMQRARVALAEREVAREDAKQAREGKKREMWGQVVGAPALGGQTAPGGTVDTPTPATDGAMPSATPAEAGAAAPTPPPQPRQDGLQINWDALSQYAQLGPEEAKEAQGFAQFAATADKQRLEQVQRHGEMKARAAYFLKGKPANERAAALALMMPELQAAGFSPEDLAQARLDDASLDKDIAFGMSISDMIAKADRDRAFQASEAQRAQSNARADASLGLRQQALEEARRRTNKGASAPADNSDLAYILGGN